MFLSCVILTKNEEQNIVDCLESIIDFSNEIIVIDDQSTDMTLEILKNFPKEKINIYNRPLNNDFASQRNYGLAKVKSGWALFLDADERVSMELKKEIIDLLTSGMAEKFSGFFLKRTDVMWGKKIKYGETGNIKLLKLARKDRGLWQGKVHEKWQIRGSVGTLKNPILHYPHKTVRDFLIKINFYTTIRAKELFSKGVRVTTFQIIFFPIGKFINNFLFKLGFLDGLEGFIIAVLMSFHSFLVRSKIWLLRKEINEKIF